jgi:hypothetical protein
MKCPAHAITAAVSIRNARLMHPVDYYERAEADDGLGAADEYPKIAKNQKPETNNNTYTKSKAAAVSVSIF